MPTVKETVTEILRRPVQPFNPTGEAGSAWFARLSRDERDALFLTNLSAVFDAFMAVADAIDNQGV